MFKKAEATYVLLIDVLKDFKTVVGRLGRVSFKKGNYIYIGSAKGYLEARLRRHLKKDKKTFWHIDYLLKNRRTQISKIWVIPKSIECEIADVFNEETTCELLKKGFGSSDCKCLTHLFYIKNKEQTESILEKIGFSRIREFEF
ncbi:MAG: GIY-YIG nuclease family protein [Candidatus Atribacteria bacterium]|nr:GIY-YIG nuclease family protein [Candidatus Atribacteria bacterium]